MNVMRRDGFLIEPKKLTSSVRINSMFGRSRLKLQDEREMPEQATRRRRMNQKTKTPQKSETS